MLDVLGQKCISWLPDQVFRGQKLVNAQFLGFVSVGNAVGLRLDSAFGA